MQVQAFRKVHGYLFASTMCASATCAAAWNRWWSTFHLHDRKILYKALHYFGVILLFAIARAGCPVP